MARASARGRSAAAASAGAAEARGDDRDRAGPCSSCCAGRTDHFAEQRHRDARGSTPSACSPTRSAATGCASTSTSTSRSTAAERARFRELVRRRARRARAGRAAHRPRASSGRSRFAVTPDVLIPRPETETLVEAGSSTRCPDREAELARARPRHRLGRDRARARAASCRRRASPPRDVSPGGARRRASATPRRHGVAEPHPLPRGRRLRARRGRALRRWCVSNPPYVARARRGAASPPELRHEPRAGALRRARTAPICCAASRREVGRPPRARRARRLRGGRATRRSAVAALALARRGLGEGVRATPRSRGPRVARHRVVGRE